MNRRDAFSHSQECDSLLAVISALPGGVEHKGCHCWCHRTIDLYDDPSGPGYDFTPPPGYETTADKAFENLAPTMDLSDSPKRISLIGESRDLVGAGYPERPIGIVFQALQYPNRSLEELQSGRCDNCGDLLDACECVE